MPTTDHFLIALQAYQEVQAELHPPEETACFIAPDPLQASSLPEGALLLGLGDDGLPLSLDLYDPSPGPLLVCADGGSGKTSLLRSLASASDQMQDVQFGVITPFPEEWKTEEVLPNCLGIWPDYHPSVDQFLEQLAGWAETLPQTRQVVLLFVDGLEAMNLDSSARHHLRWLLANGPKQQVWPMVAVTPGRAERLGSILEYFQTRLYGRTRRLQGLAGKAEDLPYDLAALEPGTQFCLSWAQGCLRFWLPPLEGDSDERRNALVR